MTTVPDINEPVKVDLARFGQQTYEELEREDPALYELIAQEYVRQKSSLAMLGLVQRPPPVRLGM